MTSQVHVTILPSLPEVTLQPEVTVPPEVTAQPEVAPRQGENRKSTPQLVPSPPEVTAQGECKKWYPNQLYCTMQ